MLTVELRDIDLFMGSTFDVLYRDAYDRLIKQVDDNLKKLVADSLSNLGYHFQNDTELYNFAEARLHQTVDEQCLHIVYLDYIDEKNRGIYLCQFSKKVTTTTENGKITFKIG